MMLGNEMERAIGITFHSTKTEGVGGRLRERPEDFIVKEILSDGSIADRKSLRPLHLDTGGFLLCVIEKEGKDTLTAIRVIADELRIGTDRIDFAGLKDAHARTYQFITIQRKRPSDVAEFKIDGIRLIPISRTNRPISSKILAGNEFKITIREIELKEEVAERMIEETYREIIGRGGIPNLFGHQRFGTSRPVTHIVGKHLLRGEVRKAVLAYLAIPSLLGDTQLNKIRRAVIETEDFENAYRAFPRRLKYERILVLHLAKRPNDYVGAFRRLPLRLRRLFIHAYQSYLFNRILSERVRCGLPLFRALKGDRVCTLTAYGNLMGEPLRVDKEHIDETNRRMELGHMAVCLPIIGFNTILSEGEEGEIERKIMREEEIDKLAFKMPGMPELAAYGGYRTAVMRFRLLEETQTDEDENNPGKMKTIIRFRLPKGSYATVALREFMKPDDTIFARY